MGKNIRTRMPAIDLIDNVIAMTLKDEMSLLIKKRK